MKRVLAAALLLASAQLPAQLAEAGTLSFALQGTNPGGGSGYRGTVSLTEVGQDANGNKSGVVTWRVGQSAPVRGVALTTGASPSLISISFPGQPVPGVALGTLMADGSVRLVWYTGGRAAGTEVWTRTR